MGAVEYVSTWPLHYNIITHPPHHPALTILCPAAVNCISVLEGKVQIWGLKITIWIVYLVWARLKYFIWVMASVPVTQLKLGIAQPSPHQQHNVRCANQFVLLAPVSLSGTECLFSSSGLFVFKRSEPPSYANCNKKKRDVNTFCYD